MIKSLAYTPSGNLLSEIENVEEIYQKIDINQLIENCESPEHYLLNGTIDESMRKDFDSLLSHKSKLKILDIGVGQGFSSVYFALKNHDVTALEPVPIMCKILEAIKSKFELPIDIFCGPAEEADQVEKTFDVIVFHASFHHCDNPLEVLKILRNKLTLEGFIVLSHEPLLKFYHSKKYFLETICKKIGDYGGNEHIYSYSEYLGLLKDSGFSKVEIKETSKYQSFKTLFATVEKKQFLSRKDKVIRYFYFVIIVSIFRIPKLSTLIKKLLFKIGLLQCNFKASL